MRCGPTAARVFGGFFASQLCFRFYAALFVLPNDALTLTIVVLADLVGVWVHCALWSKVTLPRQLHLPARCHPPMPLTVSDVTVYDGVTVIEETIC